MSSRVALDSSVIIEYIDRAGRLHKQASAIFKALSEGRLRAVVPSPVLAETFYVAFRIYSSLGLPARAKPRSGARSLLRPPPSLASMYLLTSSASAPNDPAVKSHNN